MREKQRISGEATMYRVNTTKRSATTFDAGVLVWDIDEGVLYVGDGTTAGGKELGYAT